MSDAEVGLRAAGWVPGAEADELRAEIKRLREAEAYSRVLFQGTGAQRKADVAEIERLLQQVTQRGARMQKLWEFIDAPSSMRPMFVAMHPEAADWFDVDGVPK